MEILHFDTQWFVNNTLCKKSPFTKLQLNFTHGMMPIYSNVFTKNNNTNRFAV